MKTRTGEFSYDYGKGNIFCLYKAYGKFFVDVFRNRELLTKRSIEIPKDKYIEKLSKWITKLKNERVEK